MSVLAYVVDKLKAGIITFINAVILANREYSMHDYVHFEDGDEPTKHVVGSGNMAAGGDQKKLFISKSTLIFCTTAAVVRFNNANNVPVGILPNVWYEFYQNTHTLIVDSIATNGLFYAHFEGVLPSEGRIGA